MRSIRVLAVIAAFVLSLVVLPTVACAADPADSVFPLQMIRVEASEDGFGEVSATLANICTVTSINEKQHGWLTAAHCVDDDAPRYIMGEQVRIVLRDVPNDIAFLQTTRVSAPAVPLAATAPAVKDAVCVVGYPLGFTFQVTTLGTVAALSAPLDPKGPPYTLFNVTGARGNSGSPILNSAGEIVSVLQIGFSQFSFSPMVGGVRFDALAAYRGAWE